VKLIELNTASAANGTAQRDDDLLRVFLESGTELAGRVGASAQALLTGEPDRPFPGTAGDRAALRMLLRAADDFAHRALSTWEQARTAAVVLAATHRLDEHLKTGLAVRRDDFFADTRGRRAAADEFAESILIAAQREHEEAKLPFLGNLFASVPLRDGLGRAEINTLVRLAAALTYRQLGLLAVFAHTERLGLRTADYNGDSRVPFASVAVLQEAFDLFRMSLVFQTNGDPLTIRDVTPGRTTVCGLGALLSKLMNLSHIDPGELDDLARLLR
jgi:hypothetical protein